MHFHTRREHYMASYYSTSPFCRTYLGGKPLSTNRGLEKLSQTVIKGIFPHSAKSITQTGIACPVTIFGK